MIQRPKLWKTLERCPYRSGKEYNEALIKKGYRLSDWIIDIISRPDFPINDVAWPLPLVRVKLEALGFTGPATLEEVYRAAKKLGLENPPPEAALVLRSSYDDQPVGEWLRIATDMDSMVDSDNVPHLPKLGHAIGNYYLETYWAYPKGIFHPHNEFVMVDRSL